MPGGWWSCQGQKDLKGEQERWRKRGSYREGSIILPTLVTQGPSRPSDGTTVHLYRTHTLSEGQGHPRGLLLSLFTKSGPRPTAFLPQKMGLGGVEGILWGLFLACSLTLWVAVLFGGASPCASSWTHREGGANGLCSRSPQSPRGERQGRACHQHGGLKGLRETGPS